MTDQPVLPGPPQEPQLPEDDPRTELVQRVRSALMVLPGFFEFGTHFEGIDATDLFSLNSVLGASIEGQVVRTLNKMRNEWDPDEHWTGYRFVRQSQTFPDVLLARQGVGTSAIAMGIELKGWYLLSKEGVGSFRFQVTPAACSIFDLIMIVPWRLSNIMSGTPVASEPWVASARYAAELRNYWWQHVRETKHPRGIIHPADVQPYPTKDISILDVPEYDGGGNFGRLPRVVGLMTDFRSCSQNPGSPRNSDQRLDQLPPAPQREQRSRSHSGVPTSGAQIGHSGAIRRSRPAGASSSRRTGAPDGAGFVYLSSAPEEKDSPCQSFPTWSRPDPPRLCRGYRSSAGTVAGAGASRAERPPSAWPRKQGRSHILAPPNWWSGWPRTRGPAADPMILRCSRSPAGWRCRRTRPSTRVGVT